jgi:cyanophycinase
LPWAREVDAHTLSRVRSGDGSVLIVPTAIAPDGDDAFDRQGEEGLRHFAAMGVSARVVEVRRRDDAFRQDLVQDLTTPSMVFFSGGHPEYLSGTLAGTPFWSAVVGAVNRGAAIAGCSAGAWILGELVPDSSARDLRSHRWERGLGVLPGVVIAPHWNELDGFVPGLQGDVLGSVPPEWPLLGIDGRTAIAGNGEQWRVFGVGTVTVKAGETRRTFHPGDVFQVSHM